MSKYLSALLSLTLFSCSAMAFVVVPSTQNSVCSSSSSSLNGLFDNFFEELDNFIDDATSRRLGAGSAFYGKRKSKFYGENDSERKSDPGRADPTEDYQGPSSSGFFKWDYDEEGQLRPVSRMKGKNLERNPKFWDREYGTVDMPEE